MNRYGFLSIMIFCIIAITPGTTNKVLAQNKNNSLSSNSFLTDYEFLYNEIKNDYVNLSYKENLFGFKWDNLYRQYLPQIEKAETEKEFFKICSKLISQLKDGHSGFKIASSAVEYSIFGSYYNIEKLMDVRLIENKPMIVRTHESFAQYLGYEILSINNVDFNSIVDSMLNYFYYAGNDFSSREKIVRYKFFLKYFDLCYNNKSHTLTYKLRNRSGDITNLDIALSTTYPGEKHIQIDTINFGLFSANQKPSYKILDNNIGYVLIPDFVLGWEELKQFEEFLVNVATKGVKGVIFDVRYNPGGNESFRELLNFMTDRERDICYFRYRDTERFHQLFPGRIEVQDSLHKTISGSTEAGYTKWWAWTIKPVDQNPLLSIPLVVLSNEALFSSAESFVNACLDFRLATVIGNMVPNSGNGLANYVTLPSGKYMVLYSFHEGRATDYSYTENTFNDADIKVEQTLADYYSGTDALFEKAVEFINEKTEVEETSSNIINDFILYPNYPNPFNSSTIIRYKLSKPNFVVLKIYDLLGREIQTLVNDFQQADDYSVTFNASTLSSGVYFYSINAGNSNSEKRKMIYLK